jgi:uncharacterized RDD family membrane protein YckC/uncharacterized membrane protein SpoIIM required for sporulation
VAVDADLQFETPERVAFSLSVAGLGARALACLLDLLLIFLAWVTGLLLYSVSGDLYTEAKALSFAGQVLAVVGVLAAGWGWDVAWEVLWRGQTPGKRALGLRVVCTDGSPVGPIESVVRNALRAVELPLGYAPGVLLVALSPRRQRLGDLVAGTLVVQERTYDLGRYGPPAAAVARWSGLAGRPAPLLSAEEFDRLVDFLRRRPELDPAPRERIAAQAGAALAARAGLAAHPPAEAEGLLEALVFHAAEGEATEHGRGRRVAAFVRARREGWDRLEALSGRVDRARLGLSEVEALDRLYRRTAGDLAHARAVFPGTEAEGFLSQLTARASAALTRRRRRPLPTLVALFRRQAPAAMVSHGWALALSVACLAAGALGGALAVVAQPEVAAWLVPDGVRASLATGRLWTGALLSAGPGLAGGAILRNNLAVAALAFALGLTGGIGTAALLAANGVLLGAVTAAVFQAGLGADFLAFLSAHGPAELSALALAGQGGFVLARGLVAPGEWPRGAAVAARGREGAALLAVAVPVLLLVALVEATVSPVAGGPAWPRAALGLTLAAGLWGYLWRAGRSETAAADASAG